MLTPCLLAVLASAPLDGGRPALTGDDLRRALGGRGGEADGGLLELMQLGFTEAQEPDVTTLGPGVTIRRTLEDRHQSACGYEMYFHTLEVNTPDGGWAGFLGYSGASGCPRVEWNDVDTATLVGGTVRIRSGFPRGPSHRAGRGAVLNLVPYQDFAVPRELGRVARLSSENSACLELVDRRGVFFNTSGWCLQTADAQTCLSLRNRCKGAIDAEGFSFTHEGKGWVAGRGCVVPAGEHALFVSEIPGDRPPALTFWTARCPASPR